MRALVFILILLSFFQATFMPLNLVLLIILLRSYIRVEKINYYLAFGFGIFLSLLLQLPLGIHSVVFLVATLVAHLSTKAPFSKNILAVVPLSFLILSFNYLALSLFLGNFYFPFYTTVLETFLSLPIYIILRIWEERFIIKSDIKLKL